MSFTKDTSVGYLKFHHGNELYKRLKCIEPNHLSLSDMNNSILKVENNYSLENMYNNSCTKIRNHIVYVYCETNDLLLTKILEVHM